MKLSRKTAPGCPDISRLFNATHLSGNSRIHTGISGKICWWMEQGVASQRSVVCQKLWPDRQRNSLFVSCHTFMKVAQLCRTLEVRVRSSYISCCRTPESVPSKGQGPDHVQTGIFLNKINYASLRSKVEATSKSPRFPTGTLDFYLCFDMRKPPVKSKILSHLSNATPKTTHHITFQPVIFLRKSGSFFPAHEYQKYFTFLYSHMY